MKIRLLWVIYIATIIFLALMQTSFLPQFILCRVKPDLVLLFVISTGLLMGFKEGVYVGAAAGLIVGIISQNIWGMYVLVYCLAGFSAGLLTEKVEPDNFVVPLLFGTAASAGSALVFILLGQWLDLFYPGDTEFYKVLVFLAWNAGFSIPVFLVVKYILIGADKDAGHKPQGIKSDYIIG
jgi:rod shape-determining protein MreD